MAGAVCLFITLILLKAIKQYKDIAPFYRHIRTSNFATAFIPCIGFNFNSYADLVFQKAPTGQRKIRKEDHRKTRQSSFLIVGRNNQ